MLRRLLALLLLRANSVVRSAALFDELWGDRPPRSARTTLQTYVYQLRKLLERCGGGSGAELVTHPAGYELRLADDDEIDVNQFESLFVRAKACRTDGLTEDALAALTEALALWSGAALIDVETGPLLDAEVTRLEELRTEALDLRLELELELGRHQHVVSELVSLVGLHPAHEGFVAKLMLALVRSGRRAEALEIYRRTRREFVEGLGLEPSQQIQQLHRAILNGELDANPRQVPAPAPAMTQPPAQLPPALSDFVGRTAERDKLVQLFGVDHTGGCGLPVVQILGAPGVGKTSFAVQMAHEMRLRFPDGQFYASVGDVADADQSISAILVGFLRDCGIPPDRLPGRLTELSGMFRTWSAARRVLVVLDDVVSSSHIRPLIPCGPGSAVLFCGPSRLTALSAATAISLPRLAEDTCLELLARSIGPDRVRAEPDAARNLVRLCDRLPVAVRAVATRVALRPTYSLARIVMRLSGDGHLVDLADLNESWLASVNRYRKRLADITRDVLERVATYGPQPVGLTELANRLGLRPTTVETLMDQLVDAHLVEEIPTLDDTAEARYVMPPLIGYAVRELASPPPQRSRILTGRVPGIVATPASAETPA